MTRRAARAAALAAALLAAAGGCALLEGGADASARRRFASFADPVEGMRAYVAWSVDSRLEGRDPAAALPRFADYRASAARGRFRFNADFWARDVDFSCVSPWNDRFRHQRAGTLVSPVHVVFAHHYAFTPGTKLYFIGSDGVLHYRTYLSGKPVGQTDLMVGLLDRPLPPTVRPAAILPDDYARYLGNAGGLPAVTFDQEEKALVMELNPIPAAPEALGAWCRNPSGNSGGWREIRPPDPETARARALRARFYEDLVVGDSGNPCFLVVGREPVLLYTVYSGGPGGGPSPQKLRAPLQAAMDALSPGHALREFDFAAVFAPNH